MASYHSLRFKDIVLDLRERTDIWKWLVRATNKKEIFDETDFLNIVPKELKDKEAIHYLPNYIEDKFDNTYNLAYLSDIKLDMIVSFKHNKKDELEHLVAMLIPYILSGEIYYKDDGRKYKVNYKAGLKIDDGRLNFIFYKSEDLSRREVEDIEEGYYTDA